MTVTCTCEKYNVHKTIIFQPDLNDLYRNVNVSEVNDVNKTDSWADIYPERINDCFRLHNPFEWRCITKSINWNLTQCYCLSVNGDQNAVEGNISTQSLFRGLDNFSFPIYQREKNDSQTNLKICDDGYCKTIIHSAKTNHKEKFNINLNIFAVCFFFVCSILIFICWCLKIYMHYKSFKSRDDMIQLKLMDECEIECE